MLKKLIEYLITVTVIIQIVRSSPVPIEMDDTTDVKTTESTVNTELISPKPQPAPPLEVVPLDTKPSKGDPPRRTVTYDQRQEGKYNIRADLDNFVIVFVPSSPTSGASILDFLTRTNQKRTSSGHKKHHKKYMGRHQQKKANEVLSHPIKSIDDFIDQGEKKLGDTKRDNVGEIDLTGKSDRIVDQFIEGRTPYHVDISSTEDMVLSSSARQMNSPSVRLLQPIESQSVGRIVEIVEQPIGAVVPLRDLRISKSLTIPDTDVNTNSVLDILTNSKSLFDLSGDGSAEYIDHSDRSNMMNDGNDPSIHILSDLSDIDYSFDSLNVGNIDRLALEDHTDGNQNGWELTLLGATEQCGPDRVRDSYGVCQFVPQ